MWCVGRCVRGLEPRYREGWVGQGGGLGVFFQQNSLGDSPPPLQVGCQPSWCGGTTGFLALFPCGIQPVPTFNYNPMFFGCIFIASSLQETTSVQVFLW